jgi:hypothetical protein
MGELNLEMAEWRKATASGDVGQCVEVATNLPGVVAVRDSKAPDGPALVPGIGACLGAAATLRLARTSFSALRRTGGRPEPGSTRTNVHAVRNLLGTSAWSNRPLLSPLGTVVIESVKPIITSGQATNGDCRLN